MILHTENVMLSKRFESTDVDRRTWQHVPSGTHWSTSSNTHKVVDIRKRLASIIRNSFVFKSGNCRYKYIVLCYEETYFMKETLTPKTKYFEDDIIKMLEILVGNIVVVFTGKCFKQIVGIPIGNSPLLADIFLCSYEAEIIQFLLSTRRKQLASRFNFRYREKKKEI